MSRRQIGFVVLVLMSTAVITGLVSQTWQLILYKPIKVITNWLDDSVDRQEGFSAQTYRVYTQSYTAVTLETHFSQEEMKEVLSLNLRSAKDSKRFNDLLKKHRQTRLDDPPDRVDGKTVSYKMDLFSDRQATLSVTDLKTAHLKCAPSAAKTVVLFPAQEGGSYSGMLFDLPSKKAPTITGEGEDEFGKPFFEYKKVDLGAGAEPGGLLIHLTAKNQDCTFTFKAEWRDSEGRHEQDIDNDGRNFSVTGMPDRPQQLLIITTTDPTPRECPTNLKNPYQHCQ
ncbi:hypothetical protein ACWDFR_30160 [Streptomyces sp. 900105755]